MKRIIVCLFSCLLPVAITLMSCQDAQAQTFYHQVEDYSQQVIEATDLSVSQPANNKATAINNDMWGVLNPNSINNSVGKLLVKSLPCYVRFSVDHNSTDIYNHYTYRLHYRVKGYTQPGDDNVYTTILDTLTISYEPDTVKA